VVKFNLKLQRIRSGSLDILGGGGGGGIFKKFMQRVEFGN
jgi:hypothetical protein